MARFVYKGIGVNKINFGTRDHRELLADSLQTAHVISLEEFNKYLDKGYRLYAPFDDRCNQIMFICPDISESCKNNDPVWLFIEVHL